METAFSDLFQYLFLSFPVFMEDNVCSSFWQLTCVQLGKGFFLAGFRVCCYEAEHGYCI